MSFSSRQFSYQFSVSRKIRRLISFRTEWMRFWVFISSYQKWRSMRMNLRLFIFYALFLVAKERAEWRDNYLTLAISAGSPTLPRGMNALFWPREKRAWIRWFSKSNPQWSWPSPSPQALPSYGRYQSRPDPGYNIFQFTLPYFAISLDWVHSDSLSDQFRSRLHSQLIECRFGYGIVEFLRELSA